MCLWCFVWVCFEVFCLIMGMAGNVNKVTPLVNPSRLHLRVEDLAPRCVWLYWRCTGNAVAQVVFFSNSSLQFKNYSRFESLVVFWCIFLKFALRIWVGYSLEWSCVSPYKQVSLVEGFWNLYGLKTRGIMKWNVLISWCFYTVVCYDFKSLPC